VHVVIVPGTGKELSPEIHANRVSASRPRKPSHALTPVLHAEDVNGIDDAAICQAL
jgi:hypothetical protein